MTVGGLPRARGFALVIVLLVITVLGLLAGAFAYSMKVETRLAHNANSESELEWLGRSGVELARYVLAESARQPFTALNQMWAGGPGGPSETNSLLADISLENNHLGSGVFSIKIRDLERKLNINMADKPILQQALSLMQVDAADAATIVDSIKDWRDPDDMPEMSGTESDVYLSLNPPYTAKNGPIDDLAELLLVRGVTPELYWGPSAASHRSQYFQPNTRGRQRQPVLPAYPVGLVDLFTAISAGPININTASASVLQVLVIDANIANSIVAARAGPDGIEGNEDDTPFMNPAMLTSGRVAGVDPQLLANYTRFFATISATFEVTVDAQIGQYHKRYVAILRRQQNARDIQILQFSWR
jgi:general secretion pathway protein K